MPTHVAIAGVGQTPYRAETPDIKLEELIFSAASAALADAGISRDELDGVVLAASDQLDGRVISSMVAAAPSGAFLKDEIKTSDEGTSGMILGALRVMSGLFDTCLVVSWSKPSESQVDRIVEYSNDPFFHQGLGLHPVTATAMMAEAYRRRYGVPEDAPARVVVKNRQHGIHNPLAQVRRPVTVDEVLNSAYVAWPVRKGELAPQSDGACALVLVSERQARELKHDPVWVRGMGWASGTYYLGEKDLYTLGATRLAAQQAYRMAGIRDPKREIQVAEIHDPSAYHELMAYEALGLCEPGEGPRLVRDGVTARSGAPPVNVSGGAMCANPLFCTGLVRVAETYLQVAGRAGDRQLKGVSTGVAQATTGLAGQWSAVFILDRERPTRRA